LRWSVTLGRRSPIDELIVSRTVRSRLIAIPGRLVNLAGAPTLRAPLRWPWAGWFTARLIALRALPDTG
ncbi:MAG: IS1380 family transposase, partial [Actinobacteria bacterium]|nr:IS1380 family transposase [Actinomycetota bacterium]